MKQKIILNLIIALAVLGLIDAIMLGYFWFLGTSPYCPVNGNGCFEVATSDYNKTFSIPNFIIGISGYTTILILAFLSTRKLNFKKYLLGLAAIGFLFSLYFAYIQIFIIKQFCDWCILSGIIMTAIFISSIIYNKKNK